MAVGKPVQRVDGAAKVTGRARYTDDLCPPGARVARYLRSTIAHGRVLRVDTARAKALPGVDAVFTFEDVPKHPFATAGHPLSLDPDHADVADRLLLTDHVRFLGDEIAVVVAESANVAAGALSLIEVEYEAYRPLLRPEDALAEGAPRIHPGGNLVKEHSFALGPEGTGGMGASGFAVEGRYETQLVQHCHLENHTAYAYMDESERIVVVSSTQIPHIVRRVVGEALALPAGRIRVVKPVIGGGFGAKQDVVLEPMVAFLTGKLGGRPVRLTLSREEGMVATRVRHPMRVDARLTLDRSGSVRRIEIDALSNTGAYASHGHSVVSAGTAKAHTTYPRAAYRGKARTVYTNVPIAGAMRGYGSPQVAFALECLMEDAARAAGIDPLELRIRNAARAGDASVITSCGLVECLEKGRALIRWDEKRAARQGGAAGPVRRGLGVACFSYASGTYPVCEEAAGARATLQEDGSVLLQLGPAEIGQGSDTVFTQLAADLLGVPFSAVRVTPGQDTDVTPFDTGAYASRQTYVGGHAVFEAARGLREKVLAYAGALSGERFEALAVVGEEVRSDATGWAVSLRELARDAYHHKDRGGPLSAEASVKVRTNARSFGCTFVDLEVDVPLCKVTIHEICNVHDCGVVVNPLLAEGQVHGGMTMGIGAALLETLVVDPETGRVRNNNLLDYKVPTILDVPDLAAAFVETWESTHPCGSKSLGEPPVLSPAPAIRNAILDATGVAINELPLDPKTLFRHFKVAGLV